MASTFSYETIKKTKILHGIIESMKAMDNIENNLSDLWNINYIQWKSGTQKKFIDPKTTPESQTYIRAIEEFYRALVHAYRLGKNLIRIQESFDVKVKDALKCYFDHFFRH